MTELSPVINLIIKTVSDLMAGRSIPALMWKIASSLPSVLGGIRAFIDSNHSEKIELSLKEIDLRTGMDEDAVDIIETLPPIREEELFDAICTIMRVLILHALRQPGYHTDPKPKG